MSPFLLLSSNEGKYATDGDDNYSKSMGTRLNRSLPPAVNAHQTSVSFLWQDHRRRRCQQEQEEHWNRNKKTFYIKIFIWHFHSRARSICKWPQYLSSRSQNQVKEVDWRRCNLLGTVCGKFFDCHSSLSFIDWQRHRPSPPRARSHRQDLQIKWHTDWLPERTNPWFSHHYQEKKLQ